MRSLVLVCALLPGCSFAFVDGPSTAMVKHEAPITCTTSRALPTADLVIALGAAAAIFGTIYSAIEEFNEECEPGNCYERPWGPALIGAFLVASPWGISSAVGFSDTAACRKAARTTP